MAKLFMQILFVCPRAKGKCDSEIIRFAGDKMWRRQDQWIKVKQHRLFFSCLLISN